MSEAKFAVHRAGGVLVMVVRGILTIDAARRLRQTAVQENEDRPAVKALLDLRAALLVASSQEVQEFGEGPVVAVPVGLLVDPAQRKLLRNYTRAMELRGYARPLFTDVADALRWVEVPVPALLPLRQFHPRSPVC